jgi:uncharacterized protein YgiM (DUF1202 family)
MSLTSCSECGGQVSSSADACPHCGRPFRLAGLRGLAPWSGALIFALGLLTATGISQLTSRDHAQTPTAQPIRDAAATSEPLPAPQRFVVITGAANIRSGPSLDDRIVAIANEGDALEKRDSQDEWLKVTVVDTGRVGWIHSSTVTTGKQHDGN